jgi:NADH-quinone oxidoreductase subunit E
MGTACHIKGGAAIAAEWSRKLAIAEGEVTPDRAYSLEHVACVGCCVLAPVTAIGADVHGAMTPASVDDLLLRHGLQDAKAAREAGGGDS